MKNSIKSFIVAGAAAAIAVAIAAPSGAYVADNGAEFGKYLGTVVPPSATNPGGTINTVDLNVTLDNSGYYHEYDLTYTCFSDSVVLFSGIGYQNDNSGEYINGMIDTANNNFTFHADYIRDDGFMWDASGAIPADFASGAADWTGLWGTWGLKGGFYNVKNCAPAPVVGNHGQYVSGAVKAGFKGQKLKDIAGDVTLIGPYTGPPAP